MVIASIEPLSEIILDPPMMFIALKSFRFETICQLFSRLIRVFADLMYFLQPPGYPKREKGIHESPCYT